jgi:hypothetical protein
MVVLHQLACQHCKGGTRKCPDSDRLAGHRLGMGEGGVSWGLVAIRSRTGPSASAVPGPASKGTPAHRPQGGSEESPGALYCRTSRAGPEMVAMGFAPPQHRCGRKGEPRTTSEMRLLADQKEMNRHPKTIPALRWASGQQMRYTAWPLPGQPAPSRGACLPGRGTTSPPGTSLGHPPRQSCCWTQPCAQAVYGKVSGDPNKHVHRTTMTDPGSQVNL